MLQEGKKGEFEEMDEQDRLETLHSQGKSHRVAAAKEKAKKERAKKKKKKKTTADDEDSTLLQLLLLPLVSVLAFFAPLARVVGLTNRPSCAKT